MAGGMRRVGPAIGYLVVVAASVALIAALVQVGEARFAGIAPAVAAPSSTASLGDGLRGHLSHPLSQLLVQLLVLVAAARIAGKAFTMIGLPAVVGEMAAGILLGPSLLGHVAPAAFAFVFPEPSLGTLKLLSQVGVCLFMFAVGMDLRGEHLRHKLRAAVVVSHASIVVPFLFGVLLAVQLYESLAGGGASFRSFALFMGISMSITAFPVLARILHERGLAATPLGSTAIACAAVDDVTAWSVMALVVAITRASGLAGAALTVTLAVAFVLVMVLGVRRLLPACLGAERLGRVEPSNGTLAIVTSVVLAASLCTEVIGIHALFGAFLAGVVMPEAQAFRDRIRVRLEPFSSVLLLPLFFAYTGLRTEVGLLADGGDWLVCLTIIAVATLGKLGATAVAARWTGFGWSESLQLGALMNTRGLMELIALNIGLDLGILSPRVFTMLVLMALVTTFLTGPLLTLFERSSRTAVRSA